MWKIWSTTFSIYADMCMWTQKANSRTISAVLPGKLHGFFFSIYTYTNSPQTKLDFICTQTTHIHTHGTTCLSAQWSTKTNDGLLLAADFKREASSLAWRILWLLALSKESGWMTYEVPSNSYKWIHSVEFIPIYASVHPLHTYVC